MEAKEFYNLAVKLTEDIKGIEPQLVSGSDSELCVMVTAEKQAVYAGVTSVKVSEGKVMRSCPEYNAIMAMIPSGETRIEKLITLSFSSLEVSQPCEDCFQLLYRANPENQNAEVFTAPDKIVKASELFAPDTEQNAPIPMAGTTPEKPVQKKEETASPEEAPKPAPAESGFAAFSPAEAPPPTAMNKTPKNPLAAATDLGDFSGGGDFGFEAAEPEPEPEEETPPVQSPANPENPFYAQQSASPAPQTMAGLPPQQQAPFGYAQQQPFGYTQQPQSQYGYAQQPQSQYGYAQQPQSQYGYAQQPQSQYGYAQQPQSQYGYVQPQQYGYGQQQPNMYMHQQNPQSMYMNQQNPQSMYMNQQNPQSMYMQATPQQSMMYSQSAHSQPASAYQQSNYYSQTGTSPAKTDGSTFKNRLANFMDDGDSSGTSSDDSSSEADLMKQAQERKDAAKRNKR